MDTQRSGNVFEVLKSEAGLEVWKRVSMKAR